MANSVSWANDSMIIFWVVDEEKSLNYGITGMKLLYPLFHHHFVRRHVQTE